MLEPWIACLLSEAVSSWDIRHRQKQKRKLLQEWRFCSTTRSKLLHDAAIQFYFTGVAEFGKRYPCQLVLCGRTEPDCADTDPSLQDVFKQPPFLQCKSKYHMTALLLFMATLR